MKKISKVCAVALLSLSLCACGDEKAPAKSEDVAISITENLPSAIVGEAYELDKLVAVQEGIAYSYTASYVDPDSGETKELKIRNEKFTVLDLKFGSNTVITVLAVSTVNAFSFNACINSVYVPISILDIGCFSIFAVKSVLAIVSCNFTAVNSFAA